MSKKLQSNRSVQPPNKTEVDTITMGDMALEKAERNQHKKMESGAY
jgi:hypothetical protein